MSVKYETVAGMGLIDDNVPHQPSLDFFAVLRRVNVDELSGSAELLAYAQAQAICALAAAAGGSSLR